MENTADFVLANKAPEIQLAGSGAYKLLQHCILAAERRHVRERAPETGQHCARRRLLSNPPTGRGEPWGRRLQHSLLRRRGGALVGEDEPTVAV